MYSRIELLPYLAILCFYFVNSITINRPVYEQKSAIYSFNKVDLKNKTLKENKITVNYNFITLLSNKAFVRFPFIDTITLNLKKQYSMGKSYYIYSITTPPPDCVYLT